MTKSATDLMQEIIFSAVIDGLEALKSASRGVPNTLLRDIASVHPNTTFADLPKELQAAISASVRSSFTRLLKEGYSISTGRPEPARGGTPRPSGPGRGGPGRGGPGGPRREGPHRPPRGGNRPLVKPKPRSGQ